MALTSHFLHDKSGRDSKKPRKISTKNVCVSEEETMKKNVTILLHMSDKYWTLF